MNHKARQLGMTGRSSKNPLGPARSGPAHHGPRHGHPGPRLSAQPSGHALPQPALLPLQRAYPGGHQHHAGHPRCRWPENGLDRGLGYNIIVTARHCSRPACWWWSWAAGAALPATWSPTASSRRDSRHPPLPSRYASACEVSFSAARLDLGTFTSYVFQING